MMNRRTFLCGLTLGTLSMPFAAEAQAGKVYRIASAIAPSSDAVPSGGLSNRPPEDLGAVIAEVSTGD